MNLILADYAGIGFNEYALRMMPIALAGWIVAYAILWILFRNRISQTIAHETVKEGDDLLLSSPGRLFVILTLLSLACYSVLSLLGKPVWVVAAGAATFGVGLCWFYQVASPAALASTLTWQIIVFVFCIFIFVLGLRDLGLVNLISRLYAMPSGVIGQTVLISVSSAIGSAVLNNHPMAILNAIALGAMRSETHQQVFAALIGGDLGPRLLPMGSLAGLLWLDSLRQHRIHVSRSLFTVVGASVTIPTLAVSLLIVLVVHH
jgi:arsenical pump membrane protein